MTRTRNAYRSPPRAGAGRITAAPMALPLALALALALAVGLTPLSARAAPDSAYSTLAWNTACTTIAQPAPDDPGAWAVLRCQGLTGVPVIVTDSDGRMSVWYGQGGEQRSVWASFAAFNEVHDTIEWRGIPGSGQGPYAAIHRWFVDDGVGGRRQVLVISTVAMAPGQLSCPAGYVDANANGNANVLARQVADRVAPGFRCGRDRARYHGATTAATPQPSVSLN